MQLTDEQRRVVQHETGHARVLAVAGSGKTSTLVHRCRHLVQERSAPPRQVRVLMFNRRAREQFEQRLRALGVAPSQQPLVSTFHAFANRFLLEAMKQGQLQRQTLWVGDESERERILCLRVIQDLEREHLIPIEEVDVEQALNAIGMWKGALITPDRAGHRTSEHLPLVYRRFEEKREHGRAITYDDMVPIAVTLLTQNDELRRQWVGRCRYLIVDEYQDVNYGQHVLLELLAGPSAEVMVVGDDDQTIYEWRGARPSYILRDFQAAFGTFPHTTYKLTHSFRFGGTLAQVAQNVIEHNAHRAEKAVLAHALRRETAVYLHEHAPGRETDAYREMAQEVIRLVKDLGVLPPHIWVLGRAFAQLAMLEVQFLAQQVPYKVLGQRRLHERPEVAKLLAYVDTAAALDQAMTDAIASALLAIVNVPNRMIPKHAAREATDAGVRGRRTVRDTLTLLVEHPETPLSKRQLEAAGDLLSVLSDLKERLPRAAGETLAWLVDAVDYDAHFVNYYGRGETSTDRSGTVHAFVAMASQTKLGSLEFATYVRALDPTLGLGEDELITFSTVHRTKGLEFEHVIVPACYEGLMPILIEGEADTFDLSGEVTEPDASQAIENERRLFYVAVTRARTSLHLITSTYDQDQKSYQPSRFIEEMDLARTEAVVGPLAGAADDSNALTTRTDVKTWRQAVRAVRGRRRLIDNLLHYTAQLERSDLTALVAAEAAGANEEPFAYRYAYPSGRSHSPDVAREQPPKSVWAHLD